MYQERRDSESYPQTMYQTDIHATLLEILQAVIVLCEAEKIAYFLIGGGFLGIARHDHGFVPWGNPPIYNRGDK